MPTGVLARASCLILASGILFASSDPAIAQTQVAQPVPPSQADRAAIAAASSAEREREMKLLGISAMQPPATAYDIGKPGNANYDESLANPFPAIPDVLTMNDGTKVTAPAQWAKRREEIKAFFDENVYGKYPRNIPGVTWKVESVERIPVHGIPAIVKRLVGTVDNSSYPLIAVQIRADVVTPAGTEGKKVPVIIGGGSLRPPAARPAPAPGQPIHRVSMPADPPDSAMLLLQHGWGFVGRDVTEVQADNAARLVSGIIGLVNKGQPRKLDDWGVLRAWAWTDSRILDYLETDPQVDGTKVGVMGHSRYGKAAFVTEADDPRFAIGYISSSGTGGVDLFRRNYGEPLASAVSPSEFDWYAGNLLRYAAVGHTTNELSVDSHEFLALIAPRPVFIGGGVLMTDAEYAPGDAWQDTKGMFMAAVAASPVWNLLGAKGLGIATMPPVGTLVDTGDVAFRQHQFGHTPAPNWPYFIEFAEKEFAKR